MSEAINKNSSTPLVLVGAGIAILAVGVGYLAFSGDEQEKPQPAPVVVETPKPTYTPPPVVQPAKPVAPIEPVAEVSPPDTADIPEPEPAKPPKPELPDLNMSDNLVQTDLSQVYSGTQASNLFVNQDLIRKFVVFVDNAANGDLMQSHAPVSAPSDNIKVVAGEDNTYTLDASSFKRYDPYVSLFSMISTDTLLDMMNKYQPLLDEAYQEIGYTDQGFVNKLIDAIDVALATPVIEKEIKLVAPSAMYKFADPELESLSGIQKLLIRMGPKNQLKVQARLEQIRSELIK
ncbi:hypothetical protein DS2_11693 [Catenovulum agarivorans DS-2]|uniref:DUF3014 domain-containing protein n=1 Tax=Catenovulum agarivorans DS-2 TaxID=1328313 RepID=W7QA10_9ALTE|nr:DUF3014 domain-containing protein [Catenovulum agarivorans]EWH09629.1 hypothetical protein DS2_11693 [Catenovulum agarivorans DS-2]